MKTAIIEKVKKLDDELAKMRDQVVAARREPTVAEINKATEVLREIEQLEAGLEIGERIEARPSFTASQTPPLKPDPMGGAGPRWPSTRSGRFKSGGDSGGFADVGDYFATLVRNPADERLARLRVKAMEVGTFSEGGALVPEGFSNQVLELIIEASAILPRADVYPMTTSTLKIPAVDDSDHSVDRAGLVAQWTGEKGTLNPDQIKTRQIELAPRKLTILVKASREFLQDAVNAQRFVETTMTREAAWMLDNALVNGTGAAQPQGILNSPALITMAKQVGALPGSFAWEDATAMYQALNPAGDAGAIWLFSPSLKAQVLSMSMGIGTAGVGFFPALREASGNLTLLAKPVFWTEHLKVAGQVGDALLVNPLGLAVGIRQAVQLDLSPHVYFATDEVAFRLTLRIDFQSKYASAMKLADGVTQVSDFVVLEAR